jgi:hypothetical protein
MGVSKTLLPPSSGQTDGQHLLPKHKKMSTIIHGITSAKTTQFSATAPIMLELTISY